MATQVYQKRDLYTDVTSRILAEIETGAAPWIKPWSATPGLNHPHNAISNRPYSGCNVVLLWMKHHDVPRYLTFKQAVLAQNFETLRNPRDFRVADIPLRA